MSGFLGRYEYQMDEKGRVSLPAAFRREAECDRFVLLQWESPYLALFPEGEWMSFRDNLLQYRKSGSAAAHHVREIISNAVEVAPDKQGRILVPSWLKEAAGLEGTVLLSGNIDRVELWNPEEYRTAIASLKDDDFAKFTRQIFG